MLRLLLAGTAPDRHGWVHIVEPAPRTASANGIPSFSAIAAKPTTNAEQLKAYLSTGHTRMPDFSLSNSERQALVNYILSLR